MNIKNNLFNPVPIFESQKEWYSNKETYKGKKQPTITQRNYILPMQLIADKEVKQAISDKEFKIYLNIADAGGFLTKEELEINTDINLQYSEPSDTLLSKGEVSLYIGGNYMIQKNVQVGTYYLTFEVDKKIWYSDLFTMIDNTDRVLHIRYRNAQAIEGKDVYMPFAVEKEKTYMDLYLDTTLMMPEFHFESEETMTDGYKRVSKRVSYKTLQAKIYCTEYMAEALRMLWHSDKIMAKYNGIKYSVDDVDMSVAWDVDNHFCTVQLKLSVDNIIQTNANSIFIASGDFDNDFNTDFMQ